ncbi:MAG: response regulator, partial [Pseudomonadota bacterium]
MNEITSSILLVDDHPLLRKGLQQLIDLEDELTVIGEAATGKEGLQLAIEQDPDLIILDLNMQGMDGLETLKAMR